MAGRDADVVVVGGGGVGSAAAWQLAAGGADVVLLERFAAGHTRGASHGASRIFRIGYSEPAYLRLALRALPLWRELEQESGRSLLELTGGVTHGGGEELDLQAWALEAAGRPGRWLSHEEAVERWPGLRYDGRVYFHPLTGRLHADHAVAALQDVAARAGATVRHETPVTAIEVKGADRVDVHTVNGTYRARRAVVAVGAWSAKLLAGIVPLPPLRVTQEQPAYFAPVREDLPWPAFIHYRDPAGLEPGLPGAVYGLVTPGAGIKAGFHGAGEVCDPDERDFRAEPGQLRALRRYVREWLPGADPDRVDPISCTYTTTATEDFLLDRVGPVVVGAGFSGHGFKFLPVLGRILADLAVAGTRPGDRFALPSS
ncbi:FAD-dependent oxidoreductase [Amycolatopsis cynarae]|uniref:FAD-dependent oxidoreductase n=1 Tax=Amycolatopsis cynarae TaxID=2995223 RepID=A0ABY7B7C8_9PSEU|nr:FAD-dependent oxidoreductase [Amycolatopsis sp. HUAS 11-8]WAL68239.1 FAD-dependent oxidoreductase [Amycolatopsis sp. HUAS 11-8]